MLWVSDETNEAGRAVCLTPVLRTALLSRHGRADPGATARGTLIAPEHRHGYPGVMRQVLHDIEAGKLTDELRRRGISPNQRVRVVVEAVDDDEPPITALNAAGGAFDWLADEPDLYSDDDLVERYRP